MIKYIFNKRRGILLITSLLISLGIISLNKLPVKLYPNMRKPWVSIRIPTPGYTAEDFRDEYGDTIENALNSIEDLDIIESTYSSNSTNYRIEYDWNVTNDDALLRAQDAMNSIKSNLPEEMQDYHVDMWRTDTSYLSIAVYSDTKIDQKKLYNEVEPILSQRLTKIPDAESVEILNIEDIKASITLKYDKVLNYGYTVDNVLQAIKNGYKNISLGSFRDRRNQFSLRIKKDINSIFEIENILIGKIGSQDILLKDIADVKIDYGLPRTVFRFNKNRSILIFVVPKIDGNLKRISKDIKKELKEAKKILPDYVKFDFILDPSEFIDTAISNVIRAAIIGSILAFLVIILLIGEMKNALIIFMSIPISVIISFALMNVFGVTINLISLSGMTLAVGMIVDASIVVMENIYRHRFEALKSKSPLNLIEIIGNSVHEVSAAVISSTLTTVCVFLPLSFTSPLTSGLLGDLAKTVVFTLLCSMVIALTIAPLIAYYLFRKKDKTKEKKDLTKDTYFQKLSNKFVNKITKIYIKYLNILLSSKKISINFMLSTFILLFLLFIFIFPRITKEVIASPQSNRISIWFNNYNITDQEELSNEIEPLEDFILTNYQSKVRNVFTRIGDRGRGSMIITLNSVKTAQDVMEELREKYQTDDQWEYEINSWDPASLPLPRFFSLQIRVTGPERSKILALIEEVVDTIKKEDIYRQVFTSPSTTVSNEIVLKPRNEIISEFQNFSISKLSSIIRLFLNGGSAVKMNVDNKSVTVDMEFPENSVTSLDDIKNFLVTYNDKSIPIKHFFDFEQRKGISQIRLDDGIETFNIFAFMKREDPNYKRAIFEETVKKLLKEKVKIPEGYSINFQDTQKIINDSVNSLILAIIFSIILIYIIVGVQFNSLRIPFVILVTIPCGFIGVILSLFIFRSTISLNSMLGTILLGGIVVNNAIIIIDFYLNHSKESHSNKDRLLYVASLRLRPIIITTLTTVLGMLPIAIGFGDASNIIQPLGISVAGGLIVSTFFTLFMVPCILNLMNIKKR